MRSQFFYCAAVWLSMVLPSQAQEQLPAVNVSNVRRVFSNGEHNAFTDLTRFRDRYYLAFRTCPDGHMVHPSSAILILVSDDLATWNQVHRFSVPLRDTRDPHFLVFKEQLFVYTGTWYCGQTSPARGDYDLNQHLGYAVFSSDGLDWSAPHMLEGTFGHYVWRAASFGDKAYLCGRRKHEFDVRPRGEGPNVESAMLESDDGLIWKTRSLFQETRGDETAFQFRDDGSLLAVARRGNAAAQLLKSWPPYSEWLRSDLDRYVGGPLLTKWGERWVVGGRKALDANGPVTSLCWLHDDQLHEFAELPSAGDNSYPGLVVLNDQRAAVCWYSSHERDEQGSIITAVYMADLTIEDPSPSKLPARNRISFKSTWDGTQQAAYLALPGKALPADESTRSPRTAVPLVVSLHSWSADMEQRQAELETLVAERNWYCLQPNFRGINDDPLACASGAAQQDVVDAVDWVLDHYPVDRNRVYLTGTSGGGHMTMMLAAKHPKKWAAASAWVGISDLAAWYKKHEADKYGEMTRRCCGGAPGDSVAVDQQYRLRSPLTFLDGAAGVALDISAGVHDGHTGSVPIRHSLEAFNKIAAAVGGTLIREQEIQQLSGEQLRLTAPQPDDEGWDETFAREFYLRRRAGRARVTIFEGGHEGIAAATLAWFDQ